MVAIETDIGDIEHMAADVPFPVKKLVNLTDEQAAQIADYRFKHRLKSENEAIRTLIKRGLRAEPNRSSVEQKA